MARRCEVAAVQYLLDDELDRYLGATSAREVAPMIIAMRSRAEEVRRGELERFRSRLDELEPAHLDVIAGVTRGILAKLLHEPTVALKDAAGTPRGDRLVRSEEHTSELQSLMRIAYARFCVKNKNHEGSLQP